MILDASPPVYAISDTSPPHAQGGVGPCHRHGAGPSHVGAPAEPHKPDSTKHDVPSHRRGAGTSQAENTSRPHTPSRLGLRPVVEALPSPYEISGTSPPHEQEGVEHCRRHGVGSSPVQAANQLDAPDGAPAAVPCHPHEAGFALA